MWNVRSCLSVSLCRLNSSSFISSVLSVRSPIVAFVFIYFCVTISRLPSTRRLDIAVMNSDFASVMIGDVVVLQCSAAIFHDSESVLDHLLVSVCSTFFADLCFTIVITNAVSPLITMLFPKRVAVSTACFLMCVTFSCKCGLRCSQFSPVSFSAALCAACRTCRPLCLVLFLSVFCRGHVGIFPCESVRISTSPLMLYAQMM